MDLPRDYFDNSPSSQPIFITLTTIIEFETVRRKIAINKDSIKTIEKYKDLGVSVIETARIIGKSRSTISKISKILKEELTYISKRLVKTYK